MRFRKLVIGAVLVAPLALPTAAFAQTGPYDRPTSEVLGENFQQDPPRPQVLAESEVAGNGLAVTGGDVLGLTVLGFGAIGAGMVLVRRARREPLPA